MASNIPESLKLDLRAVLISSAGVRQSNLSKEYQQITGDNLSFREYGFPNMFEFLTALEGEVTRLEFNEKFEDNMIFAVADESKYISKHAQKNARKVISGIKGKSPSEIQAWRNGKRKISPVGGNISPFADKNTTVKGINNSANSANSENFPTNADWDNLRKLVPNHLGHYRLRLKIKNGQPIACTQAELNQHLKQYGVVQKCTNFADNKNAFVVIPNYYSAYNCWIDYKNALLKGQPLSVTPVASKMQYRRAKFSVELTQFPHGLMMTTLVTTFNIFPGLISIDPMPKKRSAIIFYSSKQSADAACKSITTLQSIHGKYMPVTVTAPPISLSCGQYTNSMVPGILSTPPSILHKNDGSLLLMPMPIPLHTQPKVNPEEEQKENFEAYDNLDCKFCLNYRQAYDMFETTCKRKPRTARNVPDEVNFLVTYPVDACRFWIILIDEEKQTYSELESIEKRLGEVAQKIQPQNILPKKGQRGAALYRENKTWYRCYVLSSNEDTREIKVFFCDYGNTNVVTLEMFRNTYTDVWGLPPQAIPCQIHGYEIRHSIDSPKYIEGLEKLSGFALTANVVKTSKYCQPHIVELEDIKYRNAVDTSDEKIESILAKNGLIAPIGSRENEIEEEKTTLESDCVESELCENIAEPLFDFEEDDLVIGMIAEVHSPKQIYLHLGAISALNDLETKLVEHYQGQTLTKEVVKKKQLFLANSSGLYRRVLVLSLTDDSQKARILHVDYGTIEWVDANSLFSLHPSLKEIAWQARPATLAGVDCSKTISQATQFLKSKIRKPISANVIRESKLHKVYVEIFEMPNNTSLNRTLIEVGYAVASDNASSIGDEESIDGFSIKDVSPSKEAVHSKTPMNISPPDRGFGKIDICGTTIQRRNSHSSVSSWNSNVSKPSFFEGTPPLQNLNSAELVNVDDSILKQENIKQWIDNSQPVILTEEKPPETLPVKNTFIKLSEEKSQRPNTPPFPPPDIISSNTITTIQICDGAFIEGNQVRIGENVETSDYLTITNQSVYQLNKKTVQLKDKWKREEKSLNEIIEKLVLQMRMTKEELDNAFKESKKRKLLLKLNIKQSEKLLRQLEEEQKSVASELNEILAKI